MGTGKQTPCRQRAAGRCKAVRELWRITPEQAAETMGSKYARVLPVTEGCIAWMQKSGRGVSCGN